MAQTTKKKNTKTKNNTGSTKKTAKSSSAKVQVEESKPIPREVFAAISAFAAILVVLGIVANDGFVVGWLCTLLKGLFGYGFWLCAPAFILTAIILGFHHGRPVAWRTTAALSLPLLAGAVLNCIFDQTVVENAGGITAAVSMLYKSGQVFHSGGVLGGLLKFALDKAFSIYGAIIFLTLAFVIFLLSALNITPKRIAAGLKREDNEKISDSEYEAVPKSVKQSKNPMAQGTERGKKAKISAIDIPLDDDDHSFAKASDELTVKEESSAEKSSLFGKKGKAKAEKTVNHTDDIEPVTFAEAAEIAGVPTESFTLNGRGKTAAAEVSDPPKKISASDVAAETEAIADAIESASPDGEYEKPPIFLLKKGHANVENAEDELRANRERLESTIKSFGVNARIVDTIHGPTVTRYDLELEQGVKLSRLTNLAGDIALSLGVLGVRIAPIPDKISTVGIEVPNKLVSTVYLRDIIDSPKFANSKSKLSFAIGKDIGGQPVVGNIAKLPHLLIAGTTGSGKSVCMNSLIISLLYKSDPEDVKLIMIDPKMVELGVYNGIPHLYIPVVTDPKKAAGALQWAVTEMLKRYRLFSEIGVRSLEAYNQHLEANMQPKMPNVVVVIDELADLMLVASKEVEESICRVAQMGRAAGMHLIIATQRPSADVITGLMKANIPSRIAFAVSSGMESRIILDAVGAEKLVGMGDMLYAPIGSGKPQRVQGAFVSDEERDNIVEFIKKQASAQYSEDVMAQIEKAAEEKNGSNKGAAEADSGASSSDYDELLPQAVDVIFDTKQASVSMLQRRLKLGYSRAARIVDQMEEMGILGPFEGSKPRQILITREQWLEMQTTQGTAPTEILRTQVEFDDETEDEI